MNKIMKSKLLICMLLCGSLMFGTFGCSMLGDVAMEETTTDEDSDLIVVGFSQLGSESVFRTANTASVQGTLTKENGYFLIFENARQKQENQIKSIRSFISQQVDYIIFSPVTTEGWETVLQEAKDAGIPVILVDRMVSVTDQSLYTTWIGSNFEEEGENAGKWLEEHLKKENRDQEQINIVVLQGTMGSSAKIGRSIGFDSVAEQNQNWNILAQENGEFTTAKGKEVMETMIRKYDDIDVVVSQNDDMTFGAIEALEASGRKVNVDGGTIMISFDAVHEALNMVKEGTISVDVECNPLQGEYISRVIQQLENGEEVEKAYYVDEMVFTQENVEEYLDNRQY